MYVYMSICIFQKIFLLHLPHKEFERLGTLRDHQNLVICTHGAYMLTDYGKIYC